MAPEPGRGGGEAADPGLASISLPAAAVRRAAKSAAPSVRFSSEAVAGLHRVAQAFILFSTDRALHEVKAEGEKVKRAKGKTNPAARKTLTADHVMRFLSAEMPPISRKLAALYPDLMPAEYKPAAIKLLEQLQGQEKAAEQPQEEAAAPRGNTTLFAAFANAERKEEEEEAPGGPDGNEAGGARDGDDVFGEPDASAVGAAVKAGSAAGAAGEARKAGEAKRKRGADGEPSSKKQAKMMPASASLEQFFGKRSTAQADLPVATPARAVSQAAAVATGDGDNVESVQEVTSGADDMWPPPDTTVLTED